MKTTSRPKCGHAAHANDHTDVWIEVRADTLVEAERLHAIHSAAPDLLSALETVPILRVDETPASFILRFKEWYRETRNPALTKAGSSK